MSDKEKSPRSFNELLVICDDQSWVWNLVASALEQAAREFVRLPSKTSIRQSWERFKESERIVIYWENNLRSGGAVVEEIMRVAPLFDITENIIIVTSDPAHEDVVYFAELGISRVVKIKNTPKELDAARRELAGHLAGAQKRPAAEKSWLKLYRALSFVPKMAREQYLNRIETQLAELLKADGKETARYCDVKALVLQARGKKDEAQATWTKAIELNPHYYRAYHHLVDFYQEEARYDEALTLMKRLQQLNKNNITRLVKIGEVHLAQGDAIKAEHYFQSALERDKTCSLALNGLAEIRFRQGDLEASRALLSQSDLAYRMAVFLNKEGIALVKKGQYEEALNHYTKAQYVLPQQEKGPMLFYNIGLCYARWGKPKMAEEFLKLALIKDPAYEKALRLIEQVRTQQGPSVGAA